MFDKLIWRWLSVTLLEGVWVAWPGVQCRIDNGCHLAYTNCKVLHLISHGEDSTCKRVSHNIVVPAFELNNTRILLNTITELLANRQRTNKNLNKQESSVRPHQSIRGIIAK